MDFKVGNNRPAPSRRVSLREDLEVTLESRNVAEAAAAHFDVNNDRRVRWQDFKEYLGAQKVSPITGEADTHIGSCVFVLLTSLIFSRFLRVNFCEHAAEQKPSEQTRKLTI